MRIQKYFKVFNELHLNESNALEVLKGWEHKEKIYTVYAIIEGDAEEFINLEYDNVFHSRSYEQAEEYLQDELEYM